MSDPDEELDRGAADPATTGRGTDDRYGSRVAQAPKKKRRKKNKQGKTESPIIEVKPEDRKPSPRVEQEMDLGKKVPEPPAIAERDLMRARVASYPVVRVEIVDLSAVLSARKKKVLETIETTLDGVYKQRSDVVRDLGLTGHVTIATYRTTEPSATTKGAQLPLDFPCYFLPRENKRPTDDRSGLRMMERIMTECGIREDEKKLALREWKARRLRGVTGAPGFGFKKVVFLDTEQLESEADNDSLFYANEILHELGHAFGITGPKAHTRDGTLMQNGKGPNQGALGYGDGHAKIILIRINASWNVELRQLSRP